VDQGGWLQRLAWRFLGHLLRGQFPQFLVNERQELSGGVGTALLKGRQDVGNLAHR
jgi:hypothetical protein